MSHARTCEDFALDLAALSAEELDASPRAAAEAHLAQCPACAALFAALQAQRDELAALEEPVGVEEALAEVRGRVFARATLPPTPPWHGSHWMPRAAAAAALALLATTGWWLFEGHARPAPHTAPSQEITRTAPRTLPAPEAVTAVSAMKVPPAPSTARRSKPPRLFAPPCDPVCVARRILDSGAGGTRRPVLIQESPEAVVYWLATPTGGV